MYSIELIKSMKEFNKILHRNLHCCKGATKDQFFRLSIAGLYFEFFFSKTGCPTKAKELRVSNYLFIAGREHIDSCFS